MVFSKKVSLYPGSASSWTDSELMHGRGPQLDLLVEDNWKEVVVKTILLVAGSIDEAGGLDATTLLASCNGGVVSGEDSTGMKHG